MDTPTDRCAWCELRLHDREVCKDTERRLLEAQQMVALAHRAGS